jgi:hypothetical protein
MSDDFPFVLPLFQDSGRRRPRQPRTGIAAINTTGQREVPRRRGPCQRTFLGSGLLIAPDVVLTCRHVVQQPDGAGGYFDDYIPVATQVGASGADVSGQVRAADNARDLALLRLTSASARPVVPFLTDLKGAAEVWLRDQPWYGIGFPAEGRGEELRVYEVESVLLGLRPGSHTLADVQLKGGLPEGFSGGPVLVRLQDGVWACLGVISLGGIRSATSRIIPADVVLEFLRTAVIAPATRTPPASYLAEPDERLKFGLGNKSHQGVLAPGVCLAPAFISSTGRELPEYHAAVLTACAELGLAVIDMRDVPATGPGATKRSLAQLDRAGVFVGLFAHRYGHVEDGYDHSVTECEFDHAKARGLECLCFLLNPNHPWPEDRSEDAALARLDAFKARVIKERLIRWFTTPEDLLNQVYRALEGWLERQGVRPRGPRQLPAAPADFVGRTHDLELLERQFGGVAIMGMQGQGGIGKTTLALRLGERLARQHPDGQLYLDMKGVEPRPVTTREAMAHVIHAYLPEQRLPDSESELAGLYRSVLHGKRVLLLYDNVRDARQLEPLLPPAGCTLLVTSRRRFKLAGLYAHLLDALPPADAVTLLSTLAPRLDNATAVALAAECVCLPLALRLAGSLLGARDDLSPMRYLDRLRQARLAALDSAATATDAERSVTETLRLSDSYLPKPLRTMWRELAVLAEWFEVAWAAGVWGVEELTAEDNLGTLRQNSLLDWDDETKMYRLHDLVRDYARNRLSEARRRAAAHRHAQYFYRIISEADEAYDKGGAAASEGLRAFDRTWPNALAAFAWIQGVMKRDDEAALLCCRLVNGNPYLRGLRQHPQERVGWCGSAVQAARQIHDRREEGRALCWLGCAYMELGQVHQAIEFLDKSLSGSLQKPFRGLFPRDFTHN